MNCSYIQNVNLLKMKFIVFRKYYTNLEKMDWFNGGVRDAIASAQSKKTVFVVVVVGEKLTK